MAIARHPRSALIAAVAMLAGSLTVAAFEADPAAASAQAAASVQDGRIVYDDASTGQIFTVNPDGSRVVQVTHVPDDQVAVQPVWFPDGSRIVFASNPGGGNFRLFVMRRNGTHVQRLVGDADGFNDFTPGVAPNGRTVVYSRCRPDPPGGCALFSVRTDGTGRKALTHFQFGTDQPADFWPDVSPNGKQVAFSRFEARGISARVWLVALDGKHARPLTPVRLEAGVPRWLPDGRSLLVASNFTHLQEQIYRVSAEGTSLRQLTCPKFPHNDEIATPSPSGRHIAFVSDRAYPQPFAGGDIFVMRPNGRDQHSIVAGNIFGINWGTAPLLQR